MNIFLPPLRPPGAIAENKFRKACVRCGKCIEICPHDCLKLDAAFWRAPLLPVVEPADAPCQLCMKCPAACPTGALSHECDQMEKAGMGRAYILVSRCLNHTGGAMCWTCYDRCPLRGRAIVLQDGLTPAVTEDCVGCGVCEHVCPHKAVTVVAASSDYRPPDAAPDAPKP